MNLHGARPWHRLPTVARSAEHLAREHRRTLTLVDADLAVYQNVFNSLGILIRQLKSGAVDYTTRVKDCDVGKRAFPHQPAISQTDASRRRSGHLMDRLFD